MLSECLSSSSLHEHTRQSVSREEPSSRGNDDTEHKGFHSDRTVDSGCDNRNSCSDCDPEVREHEGKGVRRCDEIGSQKSGDIRGELCSRQRRPLFRRHCVGVNSASRFPRIAERQRDCDSFAWSARIMVRVCDSQSNDKDVLVFRSRGNQLQLVLSRDMTLVDAETAFRSTVDCCFFGLCSPCVSHQ